MRPSSAHARSRALRQTWPAFALLCSVSGCGDTASDMERTAQWSSSSDAAIAAVGDDAAANETELPEPDAGSPEDDARSDSGRAQAGLDAGLDADLDAVRTTDAEAADAGLDTREPPSSTAVYSARRYIGAYDHLHIIKRDDARGYCARVSLSFPASQPPRGAIEAPANYDVYTTALASPPSACADPPGDGGVSKQALSATGYVRVHTPGPDGFPCTIDVDIELTLSPEGVFPAKDRLLVQDLATSCRP
jgi:hypothetical protein